MYPTDTERQVFYTWLKDEIGFDPSVPYAAKFGDIPLASPNGESAVLPVRIPCWFFSFSNEAGLTGAPELDKSQQLLGKLLAYGFSTSDEPLRVRFPAF